MLGTGKPALLDRSTLSTYLHVRRGAKIRFHEHGAGEYGTGQRGNM